MAINLGWNKKWVPYESVEWSGTHNQSSRSITFKVPWNPYDGSVDKYNIKLGDLVSLYDGNKLLFLGTVTNREKTDAIGTASYTAKDFMHHLLRSYGSYKFKNTTPESITKKLCSSLGIGTSNVATTKVNILKMFFDNSCVYDIIIKAYRKAYAKNGKRYMLTMDGKKVSVIVKGTDSGVTLDQNVDITSATYNDTTDNMVNVVRIYNDSLKQVGKVENTTNKKKYGVYQQAYTKEKGVNATKEAKAMFVGVTKEASVEAIGDVRAVSGKSIAIQDKAAGLTGFFYITSDTHTFSNGVHTMSLELSFYNTMEEGASTSSQQDKKTLKDTAICYYLDSGSVYHSYKGCSKLQSSKGTVKKSTVGTVKLIKATKGKNKGKSKYSACSNCWNK